jgi:hypothetical protein
MQAIGAFGRPVRTPCFIFAMRDDVATKMTGNAYAKI